MLIEHQSDRNEMSRGTSTSQVGDPTKQPNTCSILGQIPADINTEASISRLVHGTGVLGERLPQHKVEVEIGHDDELCVEDFIIDK